jgi:hypothetical protein
MRKLWKQPEINMRFVTYITCISFIVIIQGCVGFNVQSMVPEMKSKSDLHLDKSIRILDVIGGKESKCITIGVKEFYVENDVFKTVLTETMNNAHIFKKVIDHDADIDLQTIILEQEQKITSFPYLEARTKLMVEYIFIDSKNKNVIYRDTYLSENSSGTRDTQIRSLEACQGAIKLNLGALIDGIIKRWPK